MTLTIDDAFEMETAALTDAERGRLLLCMQRYAAKGEEMELPGNERILWPVYRVRIDQARQISAARAEAGKRSGEARRRNDAAAACASAEQPGTKLNTSEQTGTNVNKIEQTGTEKNLFDSAENGEKEKGTQKEKESGREENVLPLSAPRGDKAAAAALFDRFWAAYPRKDDKKNAQRAFLRLKPDEALLARLLAALEKHRRSRQWTEDGGRYIPLAATWLNGERWNDQMSEGPPGKRVSFQNYDQRNYTEAELLAVSGDIFEEARRFREADSG